MTAGGEAVAGGNVGAAATGDKHGAAPPQPHRQKRREELQTGSEDGAAHGVIATGNMDQVPASPAPAAEVLLGHTALQQQQPEAEQQQAAAAQAGSAPGALSVPTSGAAQQKAAAASGPQHVAAAQAKPARGTASQAAASEQQNHAALEAQALYNVFGTPSPPQGSQEEGPPASPTGAVAAAESHREQQPRPAPGKPQAADLLTPKTVRALSLGLRRHGGSPTSQQGSQGQLAAGSSAAGRTGGSSAAGSRAAPAAAQPAAGGEVNSPPGPSPARSTGLVGATALSPGGGSSQQGPGAPAKAGADPGTKPEVMDPVGATLYKRGWSSEEVGILKRELKRLGHQWGKIKVGQLAGFAWGISHLMG